MRLYDDPRSGNGYKVRLALAQLGRDYDYVLLDVIRGETRSPEFLAINPNGRVPVLETDDGTRLPESNAILFYLAQGTRLWPQDPMRQAQALQWMFFEQYSHEPNIATARYWLIRWELTREPYDERLMENKLAAGRAALSVMEQHLRGRDFFVGDGYTVADIALYAYTHVADEGGFELATFPAVCAWLERIRGRPGHVPMEALPA